MSGQTAAATRPRRPGIDVLKRRWPTALALVLSAVTFDGGDSGAAVSGLAEALLLLPLGYLTVAKLQRPRASWLVLVCGLITIIVLRLLDVIAPAAVLVTIALVVLVWGAVDRQLQRSALFQIQTLGMLGFGALGLLGLAVDPQLGRYLVAAGWFLHGVWDFVHLRMNKVVTRSYAEWCGVLGFVIAAQLLLIR
ncbi:MAG TPA: hypothetical protein VKG85_06105 [Actinomycetes bacterium]|nr:hypothetical protein [Actinomycetes bacterium]